jgi:hypothetical protein
MKIRSFDSPVAVVIVAASWLCAPTAEAAEPPAPAAAEVPSSEAPALEPEAPTAATQVDAPAASRKPALSDAAWRALVGARLSVTRTDGVLIEGELLQVGEREASIVQRDGSVLEIPKDDVAAVRRLPEPSAPPPPAEPRTEPAPAPALADDPRAPMSQRRGFYLSGSMGFGMPMAWDAYEGVSEPYDGTERFRSPGYNVGFAIGGAPAKGFVLGVALDSNVGPASYEDDWTGVEGSAGITEGEGRGHAIGMSVFAQGYMRNFFLRAGVGGMGVFFFSDGSSEDESTGGMGFDLAAGMHFPVARKAAVGFSAGVRAAFWSYDDEDYKGKIYAVQPLLRFDAVLF